MQKIHQNAAIKDTDKMALLVEKNTNLTVIYFYHNYKVFFIYNYGRNIIVLPIESFFNDDLE